MSDEAKGASQGLQRQAQELSQTITSLLDNMPGMAFTKDAQTGVYLACNQAFAAYAHKETPDGVVGLTDAEIFDAVTAAHFVHDDRVALSMDRPFIFFEDVPDAAGNQRQFQTTKFKLTDASGRLCLQGLCQDVTDMVSIQREHDTTKAAFERVRSSNVVYARIAQALARGYTDLYYVNLETDELIEYHTDDVRGVLDEARRSADFFEGCRRDAKLYVHPDDQEAFVEAMSPKFLEAALSRSKVFEMTYRRIQGDRTFYVLMRVSRVEDDRRFVVIAVSDIDELVQKRQAERRVAEERVVYKRLHAITGNFICVYVVDPATGHYRELSATDDYVASFAQAKGGTDFFATLQEEARNYNHPDDLDRFLDQVTAKNVLAQIERDGTFKLSYRIMMDSRPRYVQLTAALVEEQEGPRLVVGLDDVDAQVRQREIDEEIARQKEVFDQITASLAEQYDTLYYIDIETGTYTEISSTDEYKRLNVPATGSDFFAESRRSIRRYVHPEDQEKAYGLHYKDVMLNNLRHKGTFSMSWRLVVGGRVSHIRHTEIMARDGRHIIVCIKNIDAEVQAELALEASQKKSAAYTRIAESLAAHFDFIYYVDCENSSYTELSAKRKGGELSVRDEGDDFFASAQDNAGRLIHAQDLERIRLFLDRDRLISELEGRRQLTEDYRQIVGGRVQHTRMIVTYASDRSHFIICVENRDEDIRREQEQLERLSVANELARRDGLTNTLNKTAYREAEGELQARIDAGGECEPFGIVVCDVNGLKVVNDTKGHKAGDELIQASCTLVRETFRHSPLFRIGGDEFAVILEGQDLERREGLLARLRTRAEENTRIGEGPVVASGLSAYVPGEDRSVGEVFDRADGQMYADKARLKEMQMLLESRLFQEGQEEVRLIPEDRRIMLDALYDAFVVVSEGSYVYLCDMKYDFSRWSKSAVDAFGLPAEYMYGAGDIWENRIHPKDRAAYRAGIDEIFAGSAAGHDMQYRALRATGEYDVCTCRGVVIRDPAGDPDYFAGTIRDHDIQRHVDELTGLRNQYGFFEDLDTHIKRSVAFSVALIGISRFSEVNEAHGYLFGDRVLQVLAREVSKEVGALGHVYRMDGARLAIISTTLSLTQMREGIERFRAFLHESFVVDGVRVPLDLHCGVLHVGCFEIDAQTIYARLNAADEESKLRRHGEVVELSSEPGVVG